MWFLGAPVRRELISGRICIPDKILLVVASLFKTCRLLENAPPGNFSQVFSHPGYDTVIHIHSAQCFICNTTYTNQSELTFLVQHLVHKLLVRIAATSPTTPVTQFSRLRDSRHNPSSNIIESVLTVPMIQHYELSYSLRN